MATIEKTLEVVFAGKDEVTGVLSGIRGGFGALEGTVSAIAAPLARLADNILLTDAALAALSAGGLSLAVMKAGEFGDSFNEISTLIDASADELAGFKADILDYARSSTASIGDITGAIYTAVSAGTDWQDSIRLVAQAEELATAGRADLESTTRLLVSALNAYGASTDEVTRYSDVFFQTVRAGQTTLPDLAGKLSAVFGLAAAGGVDIETLSAAIATLTANGIQTDQAVTSIRGALSNLLKPSKQAADLAKQLGIEFGAGALKAKGLAGVLEDVARTTGGSADQVAKLFPNVRALNSVLVLTSQDGLRRFQSEIQAMQGAAGATSDAFEKMARNFDQINQNLRNNLTATLAQVGQPLLDQYKDIADAVSAVAKAMGTSIDAGTMDPLFQALNEWGQDLEDFLLALAQALPDAVKDVDFSGLIQNMEDLGSTVSKMFKTLDLTDPQQLTKGIQFVVDTIASLIKVTEGMADTFGPLVEKVVQLLDRFNALPDNLKKDFVGRLLASAKLIDQFGVYVGGAMAMMGGSFDDAGKTAVEFSAVLDDTGITLSDVGDQAGAAAQAVDKSSEAFKKTADVMTQAQDATEATAGAVETLEDKFLAQVDAAARASSSIQDLSSDFLGINDEIRTVDDVVAGFVRTEEGIWVESPKAGAALRGLGDEASKTAGTMKQAAQDSEAFRLKIAQLDHDFATTKLKLSYDLQVAKIQAETDQIKASFASIDQAIGSTGNTITSLFNTLAQAQSGPASLRIGLQQAIQAEEQRRQRLFQLQSRLIQSQIDALQLRTKMLQQGGGLIKVDMSGAAPALQMVMWEILEQVQLQVNQQAADFLIGLP